MTDRYAHFNWRKLAHRIVMPGWRCVGLAVVFVVIYGLPVRCEMVRSQLKGTVYTLSSSGARLSVPGARVALECFDSSSNARSTETNETGVFEFDDVAGGECAATVATPGFTTVTKSVELKRGQQASIDFELKLERTR